MKIRDFCLLHYIPMAFQTSGFFKTGALSFKAQLLDGSWEFNCRWERKAGNSKPE